MSTPVGSLANCQPGKTRRTLAMLVAGCLLCTGPAAKGADGAADLLNAYQSLLPRLEHNPFRRELYLDSQESPSMVKGEVYAVMAYPFATVHDVFTDSSRGPANWCDVLILHPNIKYCRATSGSDHNTLLVKVSKKEAAEEPGATYRVQFQYAAATTGPGYLQVKLHADRGPLGTRDYRIALEAAALGDGRTFLHLTYSYGYSTIGRLAMKAYLATFGRGKVGFTDVADPSATRPEYVGGMRGLMERNTMRYYLAIDAYLGALSSPPDQQLARRLNNWFDASEQYPRQLHELDRQQYLQMKGDEYRRQQAMQ